ncbi:hypothetical protein B0J18DRAFT_408176 [Chaetomium sp. MPI-SDFR-AT-0129]|nr:hypothetical protein B0J18DRAFT_408176 [Chaetomium sp. MPI-SDFR-AT-0129]
MEVLGDFVDFPSPPPSMYYVYGEQEPYLSESSQSPNNSSYDRGSVGDSRYPSPGQDENEPAESSEQQKPAAKRKRENRYKNAPPAVLSRRRAQNRASQRAYRERKDQRIKDLEQMLSDAKQRNDVLSQAYASLHAEYLNLKSTPLGDASYPPQFDSIPYGNGNAHGTTMPMNPSGVDGIGGVDMFVYGDLSTTNYTL